MRAAIALAGRALGTTWPNPAVGCVIVRGGAIVGQGITAPGGRPHAETEALAMAGEAARGATAYVTLEPCSHHGHTPPCATALIEAGVARVAIALRDPDPRVNWRRHRAAARRRHRGHRRHASRRSPPRPGRLLLPHHPQPPHGHAEAGHHAGRPHRHLQRRQPVDHRHPSPQIRPRPARPSRRDHGRRRHRARRRPRPHLPHLRLRAPSRAAPDRRQPPAHAADRAHRRHGTRGPPPGSCTARVPTPRASTPCARLESSACKPRPTISASTPTPPWPRWRRPA